MLWELVSDPLRGWLRLEKIYMNVTIQAFSCVLTSSHVIALLLLTLACGGPKDLPPAWLFGDAGKGSVMHIALFIFAVVIVALLWNHFSAKKVVADAEALKQSAEKAVVAEAEKIEQTVKADVAKVEHEL